MVYMAGLGGFPLSSATPSYPLPPKITKETVHQPPTHLLGGDLRLVSEVHFIVHRRLVSQTCFYNGRMAFAIVKVP